MPRARQFVLILLATPVALLPLALGAPLAADLAPGGAEPGAAAPGIAVDAGHFAPTFGPVVLPADVYAGGTGMRNLGMGSITVNGLKGQPYQAYLYWQLQEALPGPGANVALLNGVPVTGVLAGFGSGLCWGAQTTWAYRADVTALVNGPGPYVVQVNSGLTNGASPTLIDPQPHSDGASIVAVGQAKVPHEIVIVDGYRSLLATSTASIIIPRITPWETSTLTTIGGGGQNDFHETMAWNGIPLPPDAWEGSDPAWTSHSQGSFWDTDSYAVVAAQVNILDVVSHGDCLGLQAFALTSPIGV